MLYREVSMFVRRNFGKTKAIYTHLLDFRQLVCPVVTRAGRRRRGRGPGIRHRQVEHVPLALGRVRVAAAVPGRVGEVRVAADEPEAVLIRAYSRAVVIRVGCV